MNGVALAWLVEVALIFVKDLGGDVPSQDSFGRRPPYPWELLSSGVVFGLLLALSQNETTRKPATAVAWGLVVATFINGLEPGGTGNAAIDALGSVGNFLNGGYATPNPTTAPNSPANPNSPNYVAPVQGIPSGTGGSPGGKGGNQP